MPTEHVHHGATSAASANHPGGSRRGIMDGAGITSVMQLGAQGVQLGTAFLLCPESAADAGYRAAISNSIDGRTVLTSAISGRPARCLANTFCALGKPVRRAPCRIIRWRMISASAGRRRKPGRS